MMNGLGNAMILENAKSSNSCSSKMGSMIAEASLHVRLFMTHLAINTFIISIGKKRIVSPEDTPA